MFSPDSTIHSIHGTAPRNPRRRARNDSDSIRHQRKRSTNGSAMNGHPRAVSHSLDMPVREKKASGAAKRGSKADGSIVLTRNANYAVKKLPSLPTHLHDHPEESYRAFLLQKSPYALALTHNHAFIFDYTSNQRATPRTLNLPHILKQSEPIPIGSLVQTGPSNELGLVVVYPRTGKIVFWENVDSAESLSLFQQRRQGVEGTVNGLLSGETALNIIDAGVSGFILTFSTGRLAQLTIRDAQGRPSISVTFVRATGGGGLFSGFKNVFSGSSWRKEIANVRQRKTQEKGQSDIIAATRAGSFQLWTIGWTGQHTLRADINVHDDLLAVLKDSAEPELKGQHTEVSLLDFVLLPESVERSRGTLVDQNSNDIQRLFSALTIVAIQGPSERGYALVELDFDKSRSTSQTTSSIKRLIPIHSYEEDVTESLSAQLLLPAPSAMAIIVFNKAIVVASIAEVKQTAESQLLGDFGAPTPPFQDTLYLNRKTHVKFVGFGAEEASHSDRSARCIIFAQGSGILRMAAEHPEKSKPVVTVKSKIEQAVFFAKNPEAIFDFTPRSIPTFTQREIEVAAEQVSKEICRSSSGYVPAILPSMEQHLNLRAQALSGLADHLRLNYPPLSRNTKWALLWNAEKVAAAEGLWKHYEERIQQDVNQRPLLREMVDVLHDRYKTSLKPEAGEVDPVRQWFIKDVGGIENFLPWAFNCIRLVYKEGSKDHRSVMQLIIEADDMFIRALTTTFSFREENVTAYGLEDEPLEDAILTTGFNGLPCPWTATHNITDATRQLVDVARQIAEDLDPDDARDDDDLQLQKIALDNPKLVGLCCQVYTERYSWLLEQDEPKYQASGRDIREDYLTKIRPNQIRKLEEIGQADAGMKLAEKYRDMGTLVVLVGGEYSFLKESLRDGNATIKISSAKQLQEMDKRIQEYFVQFKDGWANAWYSWHIHSSQAAVMLDDRYSGQSYLTNYLRSDPTRAKLSWINDILNEKDFFEASKSLTSATDREPNVWCKKVEASMAKLTLIAAAEEDPTLQDTQSSIDLQRSAERNLQLIRVQEKAYGFVRAEVLSALDYDSALDGCMEKFGCVFVGDDRDALRQLLRQGFEHLIHHRALTMDLLIDVLTLMNDTDEDVTHEIGRTQFILALRVLESQCLHMRDEQRDEMLKLIWKRMMLRDGWQTINQTNDSSDIALHDTLRNTALYCTLKECAIRSASFTLSHPTPPIQPSATLGAHTTPAALEPRFPANSDASILKPILQANRADDSLVANLVAKARLDHWFKATKDLVVADLEAKYAFDVLASRRMLVAKDRFEELESWEVDERGDEDEDEEEGNGSAGSGGFEGDDERGLDRDGDVEME
ncbi:hypothetical protein EJ05DRAFT_310858 [Pseudovirgaria hyperparasitica]|uniref:Nuclear pore complex subunit Nup133 n=1 Tax=Pseudovirgaria hyperparasitica TaxID=470096 RepID=A0A6A6WAC9_9PEZI|nr:uncharacterized protein EJ05DRAFT_310858 [Pseudovirgaria hyperparasitica]KAF2759812.1 hypothetical protein EJ05DRAFT_310858 [Pseudovirgaria hyperparasitica]